MVASFTIVGLNQYFYSQNCHKMKSMNRQMLDALDLKLLDRKALGLDVTILAHVKLATTGRDAIAMFEAAIRDHSKVLECYTLTGECDFLLKIVTKNIKAFEAFYLDYLSRIPCVQSVNSSVAVTVIKESTALPLGI
jgi:DNA-binding Lrp family transcriptional regulator